MNEWKRLNDIPLNVQDCIDAYNERLNNAITLERNTRSSVTRIKNQDAFVRTFNYEQKAKKMYALQKKGISVPKSLKKEIQKYKALSCTKGAIKREVQLHDNKNAHIKATKNLQNVQVNTDYIRILQNAHIINAQVRP